MSKSKAIYNSLTPIGFFTAGQLCMGTWGGYAVQLQPYNSSYYFLDIAVRVNKKDKALAKTIRKAVKESCGKNFGCINNGSFLRFTVPFNKKSPYQEQFSAYMQAISSALRENGIAPADSCAICGGGSPESLCFFDDSYQPVHSACIRGSLDESRQKIEQNKANGSYLTGFIGALLGMLVGSLPSIYTIVSMETIYSLLFALVPLAAAWGYRKFNGKLDKISVVIVVLLSFVSIFIMQYSSVAVYMIDEYSLSLSEAMWFCSDLLFTAEGLMLIVAESGSLFLFMVLGIFIAWRYMIQTNAGSIKALDTVGETLRPNPAYAVDGYAEEAEQSCARN